MSESLEHLEEHATPRQWEKIKAYVENGHSTHAAGRALGLSPGNISDAVRIVKARAARVGRAPGHFNDGVAPRLPDGQGDHPASEWRG